MSKVTTKSFIERSNKSHSNKYDYSLTEYISSNHPVKISCPIHGLFEQMPSGHMQGEGCNKCGCESAATKRRVTHEEFLKRLYAKFPDFPYTFLTECEGIDSPITLKDNFGVHKMLPITLLNGSKPSARSAIDKNNYFINKAKAVHGDTYDYSKFEYKRSHSKSTIICRKHGDFLQPVSGHLVGDGCPTCGLGKIWSSRRFTTEDFVSKSKIKHSNFYSYEKSIYTKAIQKVIVTCPLHGDFKITPNSHLDGAGCYYCGRERTDLANKTDPHGWNLTSWINSAKQSKHFESFKVYFVKLEDECEVFYKLGRTYNSLKRRFRSVSPYKHEIISVATHEDPEIIFQLEKHLQRTFKDYKYSPSQHFNGKHECFKFDTQESIESVLGQMANYIKSNTIK